MLYMVIEYFNAGAAPDIYRRARDRGRQLPAGLEYVDSWVDLDYFRCFQLMRTEDRSLFEAWTKAWDDLCHFEIIPVRTSAETARSLADRLRGAGTSERGPLMPVVGVDHVQLAMPAGREAEARAFYEGLLGVPEIPKPPALAARGGAWFERGPLKIHLGVDHDFRPARKAHPGLLVSGLDALIERLRAAGHSVVDDEPLAGYHRVYVNDPFGNRLELMERRP